MASELDLDALLAIVRRRKKMDHCHIWSDANRYQENCAICAAIVAAINNIEPLAERCKRAETDREHGRLRADVERLNQMLRDTGYGQGAIDAYVAQCEEIDRLRADAERWRWLVSHKRDFSLGEHLVAAVDAQIAAEKGKQ